jgi:hypothetical protein
MVSGNETVFDCATCGQPLYITATHTFRHADRHSRCTTPVPYTVTVIRRSSR